MLGSQIGLRREASVLLLLAAMLLTACSSCSGPRHGGSGAQEPHSPSQRPSNPRGHDPRHVGPVYELPNGTALATPGPSGCRTGRVAAEDERRCEDDEDCVLTNWPGFCESCFCPFAYFATSRAYLEDQLNPDPSMPVPGCVALECDRVCSQCGMYDAEHRPTRAVCRRDRCVADPPPPGGAHEGWD